MSSHYLCRKLKKKQSSMEQQRLYNIKNTLVSKSDGQFTNRMAMQNNDTYHVNDGYNGGMDSLRFVFS